jgi:hypothetical protein
VIVRDNELPADLTRFIRSTIPSYDAAVLLLLISRDAEALWSADEIAQKTGLAREIVARYVDHFARAGLLVQTADGGCRFSCSSPELQEAVLALQKAYDQRPVTLVRVIYSSADDKIRSFADSFKLKRD